jgi:hypothetical protein
MLINWLQNWYENQCDSDWEHDYGIRIESLDNPGWSIEIDLINTNVVVSPIDWQLVEISSNNWVGYKVENDIYFASGAPKKLELLILIFKQIVENGKVDNTFIFENME